MAASYLGLNKFSLVQGLGDLAQVWETIPLCYKCFYLRLDEWWLDSLDRFFIQLLGKLTRGGNSDSAHAEVSHVLVWGIYFLYLPVASSLEEDLWPGDLSISPHAWCVSVLGAKGPALSQGNSSWWERHWWVFGSSVSVQFGSRYCSRLL